FILDGIPPAPRGIPQVEVSFDLDANGILNVKAKDKATGREQKITITGSTGLSQEEIDKMKKDAEMHAEEDKKKKETVEVRNMADTLAFTAEKTLKEAGDKVLESDKKDIEEKIKQVREVKDKDDLEAIKKATEELSQAIQKVGAQMYQQTQQQSDNQQQKSDEDKSDGNKKDNKTVEGEFEEVK
ncbi:MAG: Hsp70 family protein, partial [Patescibacteria group bacterium]